MSDYWNPESKASFHSLAFRLASRDKRSCPLAAIPAVGATDEGHILTRDHELKLANDLAYLACTEQGALAISAVCLEETHQGLVVRLASNDKPCETTIAKLQTIVDLMSMYSRREIHREEFLSQVCENVISISQTRILQRIDARADKPSLSQRLDSMFSQLVLLKRRHPNTYAALRRLRVQLMHLELTRRLEVSEGDASSHEDHLRLSLKELVTTAYAISSAGRPTSLESKLRACGPSIAELAGRRGIRDIDRLGRYLGVCRNLAKIARQLGYRYLLRTITVAPCARYPTTLPPGADKKCHVHAEVQLVMWNESRRPVPAPRAIGCSRWACYLCHALVWRLGGYALSGSHGVVYPQWTIPEGVDMTPERARILAKAIARVQADMNERLRGCGSGRTGPGDVPPQSPAQSLLSGASTATLVSDEEQDETALPLPEDTTPSRVPTLEADELSAEPGIFESAVSVPRCSTASLDMPFPDICHVSSPDTGITSTDPGKRPPEETHIESVVPAERTEALSGQHMDNGEQILKLRLGRLSFFLDTTSGSSQQSVGTTGSPTSAEGPETRLGKRPMTFDLRMGCFSSKRIRVGVAWGRIPDRPQAQRARERGSHAAKAQRMAMDWIEKREGM